MSVRKLLTSTVLAASTAALSLVPLASAASAHDFERYGGPGFGPAHARHLPPPPPPYYGRPARGFDHGDYGRRGYAPEYRRHRDRVGPAIAIGAFAAILGLAIASEAGRDHGHRSHGRY